MPRPILRSAAGKKFLTSVGDALAQNSTLRQFDEVIDLVVSICDCPMAAISIICDSGPRHIVHRGSSPTGPDAYLSAYIVLSENALFVADTRLNPDVADSPFVIGPPYVRSYGGIALAVPPVGWIGSLSVADVRPRDFSATDIAALRALARRTEGLLFALSRA